MRNSGIGFWLPLGSRFSKDLKGLLESRKKWIGTDSRLYALSRKPEGCFCRCKRKQIGWFCTWHPKLHFPVKLSFDPWQRPGKGVNLLKSISFNGGDPYRPVIKHGNGKSHSERTIFECIGGLSTSKFGLLEGNSELFAAPFTLEQSPNVSFYQSLTEHQTQQATFEFERSPTSSFGLVGLAQPLPKYHLILLTSSLQQAYASMILMPCTGRSSLLEPPPATHTHHQKMANFR